MSRTETALKPLVANSSSAAHRIASRKFGLRVAAAFWLAGPRSIICTIVQKIWSSQQDALEASAPLSETSLLGWQFDCFRRHQQAGLSPHRLPRAFRPGAVVVLAADPVLAHLGQDLARGRQGFGIDPLVRIPQVGSDDGACALKIDLVHAHDDDGARRLAVDPERRQQIRIDRDLRVAVDAQRRAGARDQRQQRDLRSAHDLPKRIDAVVAAAIRHHQRLVVVDANKTRQVAARRAIQSLPTRGCERRKWRFFDQHAIGWRNAVGNLDGGSLVGLAVDRFKLRDGCDNSHCRSPKPCAIAASITSDDPQQLARMVFDAADIDDGSIGRSRVIDGAAKPVLDLAVAAAGPRGQAVRENVRACRDRNHGDMFIAAAHRIDDGARYVDDHRGAGAEFVIDAARQAVVMAVRFPVYREAAACAGLLESLKTDVLIVLGCRGLPRHHAAWENDGSVIRASGSRQPDQRILAGAARTDHQDEPARPDRGLLAIRYDGCFGHATRRPSRQTLRTTGVSRATCTLIRSARLPTAISPRSGRPTASAGVLVTVRTAAARSIAGTRCGNCSAAISRLEGM